MKTISKVIPQSRHVTASKLSKLQDKILAADDDALKNFIDRHGIRKSGVEAAAIILKLLPIERSNLLLRDLPRKRIKEAVVRLQDEAPVDGAVLEKMLKDLNQDIKKSLTISKTKAITEDTNSATPMVVKALDLAGRFFGK